MTPPAPRASSEMQVLAAILLAGGVYGLTAYFSIELSSVDGGIAAVWMPNAVALAYLLRFRAAPEPALVTALWIGALAATLAAGAGPIKAGALAATNVMEIVLALILVRRWCGRRPDMGRVDHLAAFVAGAGFVAPAASALLATMVNGIEDGLSVGHWLTWYVADGLGMILFGPAALILVDSLVRPRRPTARELGEWLALTVGGVAITGAIFLQNTYPLLFLIAPVVLAHAFRLGSIGTAFSVVTIAVTATILTAHGTGPINLIDGTLTDRLIMFQAFLATVFLMGLPVAAVLNGKERLVAELEQRRNELRLLADNITDAVLRYDASGVCTYASPSVGAVLELPPESFVGGRPSQRAHPEAVDVLRAAEARLVGGLSSHERFTYRRLNDDAEGQPVYIEADAQIVRDPETGATEAIVVSARNVTHRVRLEHQLVRARHEAEDATAAKARFVASVGERVRTQLPAIALPAARLLGMPGLPRHARRHAAEIATASRAIAGLVDDIVDFSRIEAGEVVVEHEPVNLRQMLEASVAFHGEAATAKGLQIALTCSAALPATIVTDGIRLRQIVQTLVGNAVAYTERGGVTVRADVADKDIAIVVEDSGAGIPPDQFETVFAPFEDASMRADVAGTGLGLAIGRQLADLLGGSLTLASEPGRGSTFTLRVPGVVPGEQLHRRIGGAFRTSAADGGVDETGLRQWSERRSEALMAVDLALRMGELEGADMAELAELVHDLAGAAGQFGESELGQCAAAFEKALLSGEPRAVNERLARKLLRAA